MTIPVNARVADLELRDLARQHTQAAIAGDKSAPPASRVEVVNVLKSRRAVSNFDALPRRVKY